MREILAVIDRPGMISFAGGLPSPDSFPRFSVESLPDRLWQYGPSEGEPELREQIALELQQLSLAVEPSQIIILSGSQQGIDLVARLFVEPGTQVALETPCYLAALQVLRFAGACIVSLDPDHPAAALPLDDTSPALAYVNPTFQNPTGRCWTLAQRQSLARQAAGSGTVLFEDDPYRDLVYEPVDRTPICALTDRRQSWIYQGSFSKSMAPGLRIGFLAASPDLLPWLVRLKQSADLHSNRLGQWLVLNELRKPDRQQYQRSLVERYTQRRDHFQSLLLQHFSRHARWDLPSGGLFFWLRLMREVDTSDLLHQAIAAGVAFMPGEAFFADETERYPALRLNFSHASEEQAARGLPVLANLLDRHVGNSRA